MTPMTDAEREAHISDCGRLMLEAMAEGDREKANAWRMDMEHAIAMRTPEQIALMETERGLRGESCFFDTMGQLDRDAMPAILKRQAA